MKKVQLLVGTLIFMLSSTVYAQDLSIFVNNRDTDVGVVPSQFKETITYVPISSISKELGAEVKWDNPYVRITNGENQIVYRIGSKVAYKNGIAVPLLSAPYIANERTVVPLTSVGELLDCYVDNQTEDYTINIRSRNLTVEERMKKLRPIDYCIVGEWVYYVTLGDQEGFHKMALDGSKDTVINDFSSVKNIGANTSITSEIHENYILYKVQELRQTDADGVVEPPHPIDYYKLNLLDNTIERLND